MTVDDRITMFSGRVYRGGPPDAGFGMSSATGATTSTVSVSSLVDTMP